MTKAWEKYVRKSPYKGELEKIIQDIRDNKLDDYLVISLTGYRNYFRIRAGKIRVVFCRNGDENEIVAVDTRGQIYKGL